MINCQSTCCFFDVDRLFFWQHSHIQKASGTRYTGQSTASATQDYSQINWPLPKMFGKEKYGYSASARIRCCENGWHWMALPKFCGNFRWKNAWWNQSGTSIFSMSLWWIRDGLDLGIAVAVFRESVKITANPKGPCGWLPFKSERNSRTLRHVSQ